MRKILLKKEKGQSLVELILTLGFASLVIPALVAGFIASREGKPQLEKRIAATSLLQETQEAVRSIRERGWDYIATNGSYYPQESGTYWTLVSSPTGDTVDGITRKIEISDVYRDTTGKIVTSGGSRDPSSKKIVISVSWDQPFSSSIQSTSYLTRYLDNISFTQTTKSDFDAGIHDSTTSTNTSGGEVILGAGGQGDWCNPNLSLASLDLPKSGVARAITAIEGRAYTGTGDNASGVSFAEVKISNTNPPVPTIGATVDGYKTNDVFGEPNYAYIATDSNSEEIVILTLSGSTYTKTGSVNLPGNSNATSVFVSGNRGYATAGFGFYIFDLSSHSGLRPVIGSFILGGTGTSIVVKGNYAYVSVSNSPIEMQIINIAAPQSMSQTGYANVNGQDGKRVFINDSSTRAYLVTNESSSLDEFFIIDISTKTGSRRTIASYDTNGMNPTNLAVVTGNKAIVVGTGGEEYQVLDINNETSPARCGGLNVDSGIYGIAAVNESDGDAYSYILTGDASKEFKIIEGGPGGRYAGSGTFTSSIFNAGYQTAFNRLFATISEPPSTEIKIQVAGASAVNGSCTGANFSYVGPNGDSNAFFTPTDGVIEGVIPFGTFGQYQNPAQCFRYKVFYTTTDPGQTPVLYDATINYSP